MKNCRPKGYENPLKKGIVDDKGEYKVDTPTELINEAEAYEDGFGAAVVFISNPSRRKDLCFNCNRILRMHEYGGLCAYCIGEG